MNWRNALYLAKGKYCLLLPDDDFLLNPFYIEEVVDIAEKNKVNLVIANCIIGYPTKSLVASSNHTGLIKGAIFRKGFWERYSIPTISNLFNREVALSLNAFHSNQILYSDIELWLKMMAGENEIYCYQKPSVYYLFHNENIVTTMSYDSLIKNSSFIRPLFSNNVNDSDIHTLICRYIIFVDSIYHIASFSFIKKVFLQNKLYKGYYSFFGTLLIAKIKCYIIKIPKKLRYFVIRYFRATVYIINKLVRILSNRKMKTEKCA